MLATQDITYTVDMFRDTLHFPVETLENLFVAPVNIEIIESFMQRVGYQGIVDKVRAFYTKFLAQPWRTMFKVFNRCLTTQTSRHDQTKINILHLFHVVLNRTNVDYAALLCDDRERDEIAELEEEEIEMMVEGEEDEESYASKFDDSMFNDDDDSGTRIKPRSHKENPEVVDDDEVNAKEKQDEKKDDDAKKTDDAAEEKENDDHTDHTLVGTHATGSMETRNGQTQTTIPTPNRSPRKDLSSNTTISEELTAPVSPTIATTFKTKSKKGFTLNKTKILLGSIVGM
ncbi:hypothetical protein Tco_0134509 [Tanacetum coccineum]